MRQKRSLVTTLICAGVVAAGAETRLHAGPCEMLDAPRQVVCAKANSEALALESAWPGDQPCAVSRTIARLRRYAEDLRVGEPYLAEDFQERTDTVSHDGTEYQRKVVFYGDPDEIEFWAEDGFPADARPPGVCIAEDPEREAVRAVAESLSWSVAQANAAPLSEGARQLVKLHDKWMWLVKDGFGQFPWERALNDALDRGPLSIYRLPTHAWVLAHPSIGLEITGGSALSESRVKESILIEPLGYIRYRFDEDGSKHHYFGGSLLMTLREDLEPGYGALFRYDAYTIGVVGRRIADSVTGADETDWAVTASIELLERLQGARQKIKSTGKRIGASE